MKYCVIESCVDYIICHASGLSWSEAHLLVMSKMMDDGGKFENVTMFELEANSPGLGIICEYGGVRTTYYILDDPGRKDIDNEEAIE